MCYTAMYGVGFIKYQFSIVVGMQIKWPHDLAKQAMLVKQNYIWADEPLALFFYL